MRKQSTLPASPVLPLALLLALLGLGTEVLAQDNRRPVIMSGPEADPVEALVGDTIRFQVAAEDPDGDALIYSWNFGDGSNPTPFSSLPQAAHAYATPGRYPVIVTVRDSVGQVKGSLIQAVNTPSTAGRPAESGTILFDAARKRVWNVNTDNHSVTCIDAVELRVLFEKPAGRGPRTLAQAPGGEIWVVNQDDATVSILDPGTGELRQTLALPYASRPYGIAFSPKGDFAYVTLQATGDLLKLDAAARAMPAVLDRLKVNPSPRNLAITHDGGRVLVTRFISADSHGEVTEVDGGEFRVLRVFRLAMDPGPDTDTGGRGLPNYLGALAISPDGLQAYVPSKKDNIERGLARDGRGLTFESTVRTIASRLDLAANAESAEGRIDFDNGDLASALRFGPRPDLLFAALQGSNRVDVIDPFNNGAVLLRILDVGLAPQGLAIDGGGGRLFVQNFMSRTVAVYDISGILGNTGYQAPLIKKIKAVEKDRLGGEVLLGKQIFHNAADSRMSKDGYISCASCHLDGGADGRVWDFTDRGEGLRRTISLQGRGGMGQGPVHWSSNFDEIQDFEHDMRGPFGGLGFMKDGDFNSGSRNKTLGDRKAGLSPELDALAAYVSSLARVNPSPFRNADGSMTAEALAGKEIFQREDVGCAKCHGGRHFTTSGPPPGGSLAGFAPFSALLTGEGFVLHDVGTLKAASGKRMGKDLPGLDTPTLQGIWESPPYLHDGSAPTLLDVLTTANPEDKHGRTSHLSAAEKERLVAYLLQLDDSDTPVSVRTGTRLETPHLLISSLPGGRVGIPMTLKRLRSTRHDAMGRRVRTLRLEE